MGMFDDLIPQQKSSAGMFDDLIPPPSPSVSDFATAGPGIGAEIAKDFNTGLQSLKRPFTEDAIKSGAVGGLLNTGAAMLAPFQMAASPVTGAYRALAGRGLSTASHAVGSMIAPEIAARDNPQQMYEQLAPQADQSLAAAGPSRGGLPSLRAPTALPPQELAKVPVPTSQELRAAGGQQIESAVKSASGDFGPDIMRALADNTKQVLDPKRERLAPKTFGLVEDLSKDGSLADIRTTRELLGEMRMGPDPQERRAASMAIKEIDNFLSRNEPMAAGILQEGNANYAAGKRVEKLEQADAVAGLRTGRAGYGGNEVNARRQLISPIVEKYIKGNKAGWSPDEINALEGFVTGSKGVNALRLVSQLAPSKSMWSGAGALAGGGASLATANPLPAIAGAAGLAVGSGALKLAAILTRSEFQGLIDKVAKRSPAYSEAVNAATNKFLAAAQAVQQQPTPAKITALISTSRALSSGLKFDGIQITAGELMRRLQAPAQSAAEDQQPVPGRPGQ